MLCSSKHMFSTLTGTGEENTPPNLYPKNYVFYIESVKAFENYTTSNLLIDLYQISENYKT